MDPHERDVLLYKDEVPVHKPPRRWTAALLVVVAGAGVAAYLHRRVTHHASEPGFEARGPHFMPPNASRWPRGARAPFPTGAWWMNAVLDGTFPVPATPYQLVCSDAGVMVSYSVRRRVVSRDAQVDEFGIDWLVAPASISNVSELIRDATPWMASADVVAGLVSSKHRLVAQSALGATMRYDAGVAVHLVKGSPAVTFELEARAALELAPGGGVSGRVSQVTKLDRWTWLVECADDSRWLLTAASQDYGMARVTYSEETISVSGAGFARLAAVPDDVEEYRRRCPLTFARGGSVRTGRDWYALDWDAARDSNCPTLSMLALRHHVEDSNSSGYVGAKGPMYWKEGTSWRFNEKLPDVSLARKDVPARLRPDILSQVQQDVQHVAPSDQAKLTSYGWVYFEGKELARIARLALICRDLQDECEDEALDALESRYTRFFKASPLVYDESWGGIVSVQGYYGGDPFANFGNALFSDHHFHYGYYAYAAAVLSQFRPAWARIWSSRIKELVLDFANDGRDARFPLARHKDWYEGHSWATGLITYVTGKSQESSSEAVNAYYAVALLGVALDDADLRDFGRLLMATEITGVQRYWHMQNSEVYDPVFAANKMAGSVAGTAVSAATWFGSNPEFVNGINVIPVVPGLTDALFGHDFVCMQKPLLIDALDREYPKVSDTWRGIILAELALAGDHAYERSLPLVDFDDGNSKANLLHFIATLETTSGNCDNTTIDAPDELPCTLDDVDPSCSANLACVAFGLEGDCCPDPTGYTFGCCPVLQHETS